MVMVVFGSTGGIGSAVAGHFGSMNYELALFSTSQKEFENDRTLAVCGSAIDGNIVAMFLDRVIAKFGRIDAVVFTIGSVCRDLLNSYSANILTLHNVLESVRCLSFQPVVFVIGSLRSRILAGTTNVAYCTSKAAVDVMVDMYRLLYQGMKISLIRPGFVNTGVYGDESVLPYYPNGDRYPVVEPSDIARIIEFEISLGVLIPTVEVGELLGNKLGLTWRKR